MECADQSDKIDVYSLGGVFYYLMSDGRKPWYYVKFNTAQKAILNGEHSELPDKDDYSGKHDEDSAKFLMKRMDHPAMVALKEVMTRCWAFKPEDRPTAYEVVRMLEEKWDKMNGRSSGGGFLSKLQHKIKGGSR